MGVSASASDAGGSAAAVFLLLVLVGVGMVLYFLPTIVAIKAKSSQTAAAALINLFFGWTLIGWVIAMVFALQRPVAPVVVNVAPGVQTSAGWHPDPTGRHQLRHFDGGRWTDHVSDGGVLSNDPVVPH